MKELIEALQIFLKYSNEKYPTSCEHDEMYVHVSPSIVSGADKERLEELGFEPTDIDNFVSNKFGSA